MQLLSCKNPSRVYNKYIDEYIFVPCGQCSICRNRRAAKYTNLLERERLQHRYSFFVTLTYDNANLPLLTFGDFQLHRSDDDWSVLSFYPSKVEDFDCIPYTSIFPDDKRKDGLFDDFDVNYFKDSLLHGGICYPSKRDAQLFLKRLNKYIFDNVTHTFKNFRYFLVSELGSTTFRAHFHAIFFVDNSELANRFSDCISACWKYGISDCKFVENSACAYVAGYINKSANLPYVYTHKSLSPFFLCSRRPFIGTFTQCPEVDKEIIDNCAVETFARKKSSDVKLSNVPLEPSYQNRLFPKCPLYGSLPDSLRIECYTSFLRFCRKGFYSLKDFLNSVYDSIVSLDKTDFIDFLRVRLSFDDTRVKMFKSDLTNPWILFDIYSFNFLRRMYYVSRRVARQAAQYGLDLMVYIHKIIEYYSKRERYLLSKIYDFQQNISIKDSDCLSVMYPEYLFKLGMFSQKGGFKTFLQSLSSVFIDCQIRDADNWAYNNKQCHFKNAYFDSLALKKESKFLYNLIKNFIYGKKCNEVIEAFAP